MTKPEERWALLCAAIVVIAGSWLQGGRAEGAYWLLGGIGWASLLGVATLAQRNGRLELSRRARWLLGAWLLLALWVGISVVNATHERVTLPTGSRILIPVEHFAWLPKTVDAMRTLRFGFLYGGVGALCASLALAKPTRSNWRKMLGVLVANTAALGAAGLYFKLRGNGLMLGMVEPRNPEFFAMFHYHNHWGAFAALGLAASSALARAAQRRGELRGLQWILLITAVAFMTIAGLIGGGRASGAMVALLALLYVGASVAKSSGPRRTRFLDGFAAALLVVGAATTAVAFLGREKVVERIEKTQEQIAELREGTINDIRLYAAPRDTLHMIKDRPLSGWGLGSYLHVFPQYAGEEFYSPHYKEIRRMDYAHNDYLQFIAELGSLGFLLFVTPPLILLLRSRVRNSSICFWCLAGCGVILGLSLVEFPFGNPAVMTFFAVMATTGIRYLRQSPAMEVVPLADRPDALCEDCEIEADDGDLAGEEPGRGQFTNC